jgi:hypothetical protein
MSKREKQFIFSGLFFLASAILYYLNFKESSIFIYSIFLGIGVFALLLPWVNFDIKKKRVMKLAIILFFSKLIYLYASISDTRIIATLGLMLCSFSFTWVAYTIYKYIRFANKNIFLKILLFLALFFISYLFFKYVPLILLGVIFGFD